MLDYSGYTKKAAKCDEIDDKKKKELHKIIKVLRFYATAKFKKE